MEAMPADPYDPYRQALENDAREAVLGAYTQIVYSNPRIDVADGRNMLERYNNGDPLEAHREALGAAEKRHMEVSQAGGTPLAAAVAAKELLQDSLEKGRQHDNKDLSATDQLLDHVRQGERTAAADGHSATQDLLQHFQDAKHEITGPVLDPLEPPRTPPGRGR
jgi:hypothetical protein